MRADDIATQLEEKQREVSLRYRKPQLTACGKCYNCEEPLPETILFCDADCRDDFEKRQKAKNNA